MGNYSVTEPTATREGEEIVLKVKAPAGFVRVRMSPNDASEAVQQLLRALAMPSKR